MSTEKLPVPIRQLTIEVVTCVHQAAKNFWEKREILTALTARMSNFLTTLKVSTKDLYEALKATYLFRVLKQEIQSVYRVVCFKAFSPLLPPRLRLQPIRHHAIELMCV